jgi:hypothetical protein
MLPAPAHDCQQEWRLLPVAVAADCRQLLALQLTAANGCCRLLPRLLLLRLCYLLVMRAAAA